MLSDPKELLTERELAELWKVTPDCLQKMRHEGRGPCFIRIGRLVRYRMSDVIRYEKENCVGTNTQPESDLAAVH
jgi:hypothetical protein